jgi:hypothetical protein
MEYFVIGGKQSKHAVHLHPSRHADNNLEV